MEKRQMKGYYCATKEEALEKVMSMIPAGSSVGWGGSVSIEEAGIKQAVIDGDFEVYNRDQAKTPEEQKEVYRNICFCDYYLTGTNAVTIDGELVNIDGNSNRVSCLCHGPSHVMMFVGMNKVTADVESAVKRVRTYACPANADRLNRNTPCGITGVCGDCLADDCFCNQIVITRRSGHKGRIKVFLIGEELGF
jgi:hypothetical protein